MKKLLLSTVILLTAMMAMATEKAYVQIRLTGESGQYSDLFLTEDDEYTSAFESGADVENLMILSNSKSVLIYAKQGSVNCEEVWTNSLKGLEIGFTTNMVDENYTLTFKDKSGTSIKLYDYVTGSVIDLDAVTSYNFSVDGSLVGQKEVWDRFVVNVSGAGEGKLETCFTGTELNITNNPYFGKIVVKDGGGSTIKSYDYGTSSIDFNEKTAKGYYYYTNGADYTVSFGGARAFIVTVKR